MSSVVNRIQGRTPENILMLVSLREGGEKVECLFSPFGNIDFWPGSGITWVPDKLNISKGFLEGMDWELEDVTGSVWVVSRFNVEKPLREDIKKERLYVVKRVGCIQFDVSDSERLCFYNDSNVLEGWDDERISLKSFADEK